MASLILVCFFNFYLVVYEYLARTVSQEFLKMEFLQETTNMFEAPQHKLLNYLAELTELIESKLAANSLTGSLEFADKIQNSNKFDILIIIIIRRSVSVHRYLT